MEILRRINGDLGDLGDKEDRSGKLEPDLLQTVRENPSQLFENCSGRPEPALCSPFGKTRAGS